MLGNPRTIEQKKRILFSMLKELDYLFCSDCVSKKFLNEYGEEVRIELTTPDDEKIEWEVIINGKQDVVCFSKKEDFVNDFLKINDEHCYI